MQNSEQVTINVVVFFFFFLKKKEEEGSGLSFAGRCRDFLFLLSVLGLGGRCHDL